MARYRRSAAYCVYCDQRVWAARRNHFFTKWHCERCGTLTRYLGDASVRYAEGVRARERAEERIRANPHADLGGMPVAAYPGEDPTGTIHTGLLNTAFGWLVRRRP